MSGDELDRIKKKQMDEFLKKQQEHKNLSVSHNLQNISKILLEFIKYSYIFI